MYDRSIAPSEKQVMRIFVRAVPAVICGDMLKKIRGKSWTQDAKEAYSNRILDLIEVHAPGLLDRILDKVVQSPLDLEALNLNLVQGDNNAGSMQFSQFYSGCPFAEITGHRTPILGLYFCRASTWPGGGTNPGSGEFVTRQILEDYP